MAITYELATDIILPNITVHRKLKDGVCIAHRLTANDGYVIHDTTDENYEPKRDENGDIIFDENYEPIMIPVIYYFREAHIPVSVPPENWTWVAVPESTVDENYIFGGGDNDNNHEVM